LPREDTQDGYITDQAIAYIEDYEDEKPLFLSVGLLGPHGPYWSPTPFAEMFDPAKVADPIGVRDRFRSGSDAYAASDLARPRALDDPAALAAARGQRAAYLGLVAFIDHNVGLLLQALARKGWAENTLVVFTSDHGVNLGDHGIGGKRFYYEQSVKVPLIVSGSGVPYDARVGWTQNRSLVSGVDLYPTFLDAAGFSPIHGAGRREGISLLQLLTGRTGPRAAVFSELGTTMMVRDAGWKLVYDPEQGGVQYLFNLRRDANELENLAGRPDYRAVEADLTELLLDRMIRLTHFTHAKEQVNLQRVRV
jgi:arylsulfatase A-like enzyme